METSKIVIRPFKPSHTDETVDGREPYAVLTYGNVTIELDYTIMRHLTLGVTSDVYHRIKAITNESFDEIVREMEFNMNGKTILALHPGHRDVPKHPDNLFPDYLAKGTPEIVFDERR